MNIEVENVMKIDGVHYHIDDIVKLIYIDGKDEITIIGRIDHIDDRSFKIDYSEKYTASTTYVYFDTIKSIEKVEVE